MAKWYKYRVFDCEKNEWFPGVYQNRELNEMFGVSSFHPSDYASSGILFRRRYQLVFASEVEMKSNWVDWAKE